MEVSHFELIFKPQSPAAPPTSGTVASVIQGYFLEITNLENKELRYALEFVATAVTDPNRSLSGNALIFVDTPGVDNSAGVLNGAITAEVFTPSTGLVTVPPRATALVAVLPSAFGPTPLDPTPLAGPTFEVRGYVRIRLPALFQRTGPFGIFKRVAQSDAPVRVLLTPQFRATYFATDGSISDQTQSSVPTASGKGENHLPPDPGGPIILNPPVVIDFDIAQRLAAAEGIESQMLASLLAGLDGDGGDLAGFNEALGKAGVPFAIERRKRK